MEDIQEILDFIKIYEDVMNLMITLSKKLGDHNE